MAQRDAELRRRGYISSEACWAEDDIICRAEVDDDATEGDVGANPTMGEGAVVTRRQVTADAIRGLM